MPLSEALMPTSAAGRFPLPRQHHPGDPPGMKPPFCNGRCVVKAFVERWSVRRVGASVRGRRGVAIIMGSVRTGRFNLRREVTRKARRRGGLRPDLVRRPGEGTSAQGRGVWCPVLKGCCCGLLGSVGLGRRQADGGVADGGVEGRLVDEHAMHDHGELAGQGDLGLAHADPPGERLDPVLWELRCHCMKPLVSEAKLACTPEIR